MKIWNAFGSEHSANLVMIGKFKEPKDAEDAKNVIDSLKEQVRNDERSGAIKIGELSDRYADAMLDLLSKLSVHSIAPAELEQLAYDFDIEQKQNELVLTTQEIDVSAFLKIFIDKGAKVEVYSAHNYPDTAHGH